ncbi:MAG: DUF2975 domain-containing protein [Lachnospirales bacterium]
MNTYKTKILKIALCIVPIPVYIFTIIMGFNLNQIMRNTAISGGFFSPKTFIFLITLTCILAVVPLTLGIYNALKLLACIEREETFTEKSVNILVKIQKLTTIFTCTFLPLLPASVVIAELDDAPGAVFFALLFICIPFCVTVFVSVVLELWQSAYELQKDKDLTI